MLIAHILFPKTEKKIVLRNNEGLFLSVRKQLDDTYIVYELIKRNIEICYAVMHRLNCIICYFNEYDCKGIPFRHEYAVAKSFSLKNKLG